jgi:2-C-methyl-D-erythritol 4-phosphate cytidylyltransferase
MADCSAFDGVLAGLKTLLRKAAERTVKATWKRIGTLHELIPQTYRLTLAVSR